jgi:hypothetical protein
MFSRSENVATQRMLIKQPDITFFKVKKSMATVAENLKDPIKKNSNTCLICNTISRGHML